MKFPGEIIEALGQLPVGKRQEVEKVLRREVVQPNWVISLDEAKPICDPISRMFEPNVKLPPIQQAIARQLLAR